MKNDGVESNTVQKAQAKSELINLVKNSSSDFDDGEFGRLRRMRSR